MCGSCKHLENAWFDVMIVWRELQSTKGRKREYAWHVCVCDLQWKPQTTRRKKILQINILSAMLLPLNVNTANHVALNRNKALNSQQPKEEEEKE